VQSKDRLDSSRKMQQISNSYICFVRPALPFRDSIFHGFIQVQDSVLFGSNRCGAPEALRAAKDRGYSIGTKAV
jgi:hypothetical protein